MKHGNGFFCDESECGCRDQSNPFDNDNSDSDIETSEEEAPMVTPPESPTPPAYDQLTVFEPTINMLDPRSSPVQFGDEVLTEQQQRENARMYDQIQQCGRGDSLQAEISTGNLTCLAMYDPAYLSVPDAHLVLTDVVIDTTPTSSFNVCNMFTNKKQSAGVI